MEHKETIEQVAAAPQGTKPKKYRKKKPAAPSVSAVQLSPAAGEFIPDRPVRIESPAADSRVDSVDIAEGAAPGSSAKKPRKRNRRRKPAKAGEESKADEESKDFDVDLAAVPTAGESKDLSLEAVAVDSSTKSKKPKPKRKTSKSEASDSKKFESSAKTSRDFHVHETESKVIDAKPKSKPKAVRKKSKGDAKIRLDKEEPVIPSKPGCVLENAKRFGLTGAEPPLTMELIDRLSRNASECMICYDRISRKAPVWSCGRCFVIFDLDCIKQWFDESADSAAGTWRCPACQFSMPLAEKPKAYYCFCNKTVKPDSHPTLIPHSCGQTCSKTRAPGCPHPCTLHCHPGPCPPCGLPGVTVSCPCGKSTFTLKCGEEPTPGRMPVCESTCRKLLNCSIHICKRNCHEGPCSACDKTVDLSCFCGKSKSAIPCGTGIHSEIDDMDHFECGEICGKTLDCQLHSCLSKCHRGLCQPCQRVPKSLGGKFPCACGKKVSGTFKRDKCTDEFPSCGDICGKALSCGKHVCSKTCHDSLCGDCTETQKVPCRCGLSMVSIPCGLDFTQVESKYESKVDKTFGLCEKKCKSMLACGSHRCQRLCCPKDGLDEKGFPMHKCLKKCGKPLNCGLHTCDNYCHLGPCDPCAIRIRDGVSCFCGKSSIPGPVPCGTKPPKCTERCTRPRECGHRCPYPCHAGDCPPCVVLVEKMCAGNHQLMKSIKCYSKTILCGRPCLKSLVCGLHQCKKLCHTGPCDAEDAKEFCSQTCDATRSECGHPCNAPCHGLSKCPKISCRSLITVSCDCGRRFAKVECGLGGADGLDLSPEIAHHLPCDEKCEIEARNRKLAAALKISPENSKRRLPYTESMLGMALDDMLFVEKTERVLLSFVDSKDSSERNLYLPPMPMDRRQLVHEMAPFFGLLSESLDQGARRFVRLTKTLTSHSPVILLSEAARIRSVEADKSAAYTIGSDPSKVVINVKFLRSDLPAGKTLRGALIEWEGKYRMNHVDDSNFVLEVGSSAMAKSMMTSLAMTGNFAAEIPKKKKEDFAEPPVEIPSKPPTSVPPFPHESRGDAWDDAAPSALAGVEDDWSSA